MSNSPDAPKRRKVRKLRVLTDLEKLDGHFPGLATETRMLLDHGASSAKAAEILSARFQTPVKESNVLRFRSKRWAPAKDKVETNFNALEVFFKKSGGNYGLDLVAFAKVHELLNTSEIKDANAVRLALVKIRAQDLKEEEFKFKTSQVESSKTADGQDIDPEAQSRDAVRKIKEIFGLAGDQPPQPPARVVPAAAGKESA